MCINAPCQGIIRPDIVFFGESLPKAFSKNLTSDFEECDLLITMGTSLQVPPFAHLPKQVHTSCPRILINRERCGLLHDHIVHPCDKRGGFDFESSSSTLDYFISGNCDDIVQDVVNKLGWTL